MLIYSMDRKCIVDAKTLQVTRNIGGGKDAKYAITAEGMGGLASVIAAQFPDDKTAIDALEKAFAAFADGASAYKFD